MQTTVDLDLELLQTYDDCGGETLLTTVGSKVTSTSGMISGATNAAYQLFFMILDEEWQQRIIDDIDTANMSREYDDWERVGFYAGAIIAQLMEFQVPSTSFVFGETLVSEVLASV